MMNASRPGSLIANAYALWGLAVALMAMDFSPAAYAAERATGVSEGEVVQALSLKGFSVRVGNDSFHEPIIESFAGSVRFYIYFYDCDQARRCGNIQFRSGFATHRGLSLDRINDWSTRWRFGRLYLDPEGDAILDMDVDVSRGVAPEQLAAQVDRWLNVMNEAKSFLGWQR